ncbi:RNA polymerase sigma factor [Apibacter adventoris]|uniref:RNA polymerase sigma factor n=1 Tax=Apibacter adventoris TaxID=1679466 RepID=UPI001C8846C5|nr:sigma-70 family RNA polymerase sigma factor [Apibacter adventoris]
MKIRFKISQLSDEELLRKYKETLNSEYFGVLYNKYIPLIYGLCLKYLKDDEKAQDAVMQIFENLVTKIINYSISNFKTWIYSVARNHCLQEIRAIKKEIFTDFNEESMESVEILYLLDEQNEDQKFSILKQCIEKLPEPQRISIEKFFFKEKSYAEIVIETKYHLKSVKSYIQNGKRNLKICMEKNSK